MLDKDTVYKVAQLARLTLSDAEARSISEQLSAALENFKQISSVDTAGVAPLVSPIEIAQVLREDFAAKSGGDAMLGNSPEKSGRLYKVPPVV